MAVRPLDRAAPQAGTLAAVDDHSPDSLLTHLECGLCGTRYDADVRQGTCSLDARPLLARYDLARARATIDRDEVTRRPRGLWRWAELLPVRDPAGRLTLGEGDTPLLVLRRMGAALGMPRLFAKDEGRNPTGSFKARGMAVAVSRAVELGATSLATPSAGNAGAALAAYAARAGIPATVAVPSDAPASARDQVLRFGARLELVEGLIGDAGTWIRGLVAATPGMHDLSTLREPYRAEGKKTMGLELAEQLGWRLPDVVVYPAGGGTGIVGMWKAFAEMEALGWIGTVRPRLVLVQSSGCAPLVRAWDAGERFAEPWVDARTAAAGLRVPSAVGDFLILDAVRASDGLALTVDDPEMARARRDLAVGEGLDVSLEAAATVAAVRRLVAEGSIDADAEVVLFLTGSGLLD
jgi:threonine synthase